MRNWLLILALFSVVNASGQTATVTGIITSGGTDEPLPGTTVSTGPGSGTSAGMDGRYSLTLSAGRHELTFRLISFAPKTISIELAAGEVKELNVSLFPEATELGVIVISAGKFEQRIEDITVSMEVLKPSVVEARNTTTLEEAVDLIPGVTVVDGQANIRGGSGWSYGAGSRVQILVDDLPQLTADANDAKWNFLPIENLAQVEVIKGASSVLFGSSALNGVINVRTAYPADTPKTKINLFRGVYDGASHTIDGNTYRLKEFGEDFTTGLNVFHSRKAGQFDLTGGLNLFNDEGYRESESERRLKGHISSRYRFKNVEGLSAGINVSGMKTESTLFFLWENDTAGAYTAEENTLSESNTLRLSVDPFVTYVDSAGNSHRLRTRWFKTVNENNTDQNSTADLLYAEYQYQRRFNDKIIATGGLVRTQSYVTSELYGDHDGHQSAAYLQGDFKWKKFTFSAGARVEQNQVDSASDELTPVFRTGINYRLFGETYLRASAGQGYRFPSIAEKYVRTQVGNILLYPNPGLNPERGTSYEIGIKQGIKLKNWKGYADVAVFRNEYSDMMEFVFAQWGVPGEPFNGNGFRSLNIGDTRIEGFELTMNGSGKLSESVALSLFAGYTYIDPRQVSYDSLYVSKIGKRNVLGSDSTDFLKYRSRHTVKGDAEVSWRKLSVGFGMRYTSRMENIDKIFIDAIDVLLRLGIKHYRTHHLGGDMLFDARASYEVHQRVKLSFIVRNLFNHIYMQRPGDMQAPRLFVVQAGINF